ncbi:Bis(5'-adenosyl)-triphosphatase ENPP4 [Thelohanellus kitauei]|uniref:Bis(5'-adenosyl)-triphosphatase ENPP4 n=1 Tax=Thelohanellus kitauei TaxID=669202 RepID=A0A0C2JBG3_THEKT|nr:Bis(5'-adenosyl)-triphosphatase ENPP4 [Thelohanellus kitauei]
MLSLLLFIIAPILGHQEPYCPKLIWISAPSLSIQDVDGFAFTTLKEMKRSLFIRSIFPYTFADPVVNEFSQATGRDPLEHGILSSIMTHEESKKKFTPESSEIFWWNRNGSNVPIWMINDDHGERPSYVLGWPGINAISHRLYRDTAEKSILNVAAKLRFKEIDSLIAKLKEESFDLLMVSLKSFESNKIKETNFNVKILDNSMNSLFQKLDAMGCNHKTNVILSSSVGMCEYKKRDITYISHIISPFKYSAYRSGATLFVKLELEEMSQKFVENYNRDNSAYGEAFLTSDLLKTTKDKVKDVPGIVIIPHSGKFIKIDVRDSDSQIFQYGYNPARSDCTHGLLLGLGPNLRQRTISYDFSNIQVFHLVCKIMNLDQRCIGFEKHRSVIRDVYQEPQDSGTMKVNILYIIIPIAVFLVLALSGLGIYFLRLKRAEKLMN